LPLPRPAAFPKWPASCTCPSRRSRPRSQSWNGFSAPSFWSAGRAGWPSPQPAVASWLTLMPRVIGGLAERHPGIELDFMEGSHAFLNGHCARAAARSPCCTTTSSTAAGWWRTPPSTWSPPLHLTWSSPPGTGSPAGTRSISRRSWRSRSSPSTSSLAGSTFWVSSTSWASRRRSGCGQRAMKWCGRWSPVAWVTPCSPRGPRSRPPTNGTPSSPCHWPFSYPHSRSWWRRSPRPGPAHEEGPGIPGPVPGVVRPGHAGLSRVAPVAVRA
jgi:hypothetical protein